VCACVYVCVCVCIGVAPTASLRGWYGETHCIIFDVLRPVLQWHPDTEALMMNETKAVVGCTTKLATNSQKSSTQ
jgi:hypothetical protein